MTAYIFIDGEFLPITEEMNRWAERLKAKQENKNVESPEKVTT